MPKPEGQSSIMLSALLHGVVGLDEEFDVAVEGLCSDSREVVAGDVFIAQCGLTTDASRFAAQAYAGGAVAIVEHGVDRHPWRDTQGFIHIPVENVNHCLGQMADRFYAEPSQALQVIAITGTSGKTSVAHYVAQALELLAKAPVGLMGTMGQGRIGDLSNAGLTTADCLSVHRCLSEFRDQGAQHVVMEASSHALVQGRLLGIKIHTAVFTNLSRDHLDYHRDMQDYANAKSLLFQTPGLRCAAINMADSNAHRLTEVLADDVKQCGYQLGTESSTQVQGELLLLGAQGLSLKISVGENVAVIESELLGEVNAWNLLTCTSVLLLQGFTFNEIIKVLGQLEPVAGRMQAFGGGEQPLVVVDYSHKPAALSAALNTLRPVCEGKLWCVFGCGGDRDSGKRAEMGEVAEQLSDQVIVTDDNPRTEDGDDITAQILSGMQAPELAILERDRGTAIAQAIHSAGAGDVVLIAGKGHESYQEIQGQRFAFSDIAAVRNILGEPR